MLMVWVWILMLKKAGGQNLRPLVVSFLKKSISNGLIQYPIKNSVRCGIKGPTRSSWENVFSLK